jgi:PEP-CTERM motif
MPVKIVRLIFLLLLLTPAVSADPITITSGTIVVVPVSGFSNGVRTLPFTISGMNFSGSFSQAAGVFSLSACSAVSGINPPCNTANGSWLSIGSDNFGSFTLNGTTYASNVLNQISLFVSTFDIVVPPELQNNPNGVMATAAFGFSGVINTLDGQHADLIGQGTFSLLLRQMNSGPFTGLYLERAVYTFGPAPEGITVQAVPEPATILLLLSSLAGAGMWRRSRRRI